MRRKKYLGISLSLQRDFSLEAAKDSLQGQSLGEAVVSATKIKMFYKGDTLIYNANAFKLSDGSMLDDLIRQLPGAELKDNGEILINGRKLDFLLLNGKSFFNGNNKIMLDNLPYFIIDQLKVYEEDTQRSKDLGHTVEEKVYVMDVRVKKEYSIGTIGNVEVAGGTHERYLARLFALRFTDFSRLTFFAGSNNVNETRKPGADTGWTPSDNVVGTEQIHNAGIDFVFNGKNKKWEDKGSAVLSWKKTVGEDFASTETFLTDRSSYGQSLSEDIYKNLTIDFNNTFKLPGKFHPEFNTEVHYDKSENNGSTTSLTSNTPFDTTQATDTVNTTLNMWKGNGWDASVKQAAKVLRHLEVGDDLEISAYASWNKKVSNDYSLYTVKYISSPIQNDARNRYNDSDKHGYEYGTYAAYSFNFLHDISWHLSWHFTQRQTHNEQMKYRLDQIADWDSSDNTFGLLPSSMDLLRTGIDNNNSYTTNLLQKKNILFTRFSVKVGAKKNHRIELGYAATHSNERLHYASMPIDTLMRQIEWLHRIMLSYSAKAEFSKWEEEHLLRASYHTEVANIHNMVPVRNTYNPLAIVEGNPNLKNSFTQMASLSSSLKRKGRRTLLISNSLEYNLYGNRIATAVNYEKMTGIFTYRPKNVNGNYRVDFANSVTSMPMNNGRLSISNRLQYVFDHNVDLILDSEKEDWGECVQSKVNTHYFKETLSAKYDFGKYRIGMTADIAHRYATSERENFQTINATDFSYGVNAQMEIPWQLTFNTDIKMFSRRGYGDSSMNTNDLVWNASISRSFFKKRLNVKLQGFDLLRQLSNVTYTINGQGRTESWHRTISQYLMLHLQWKLNMTKKKIKVD